MIRRSQIPEPKIGVVADAVKGNWVDEIAPAWSRPYLRLSRADRPIGTWLLYIPGLWAIALAANDGNGLGWWDLWLVISSGIGAILMRGAGCTWNDITDQDFDASVARTRSRPLPSGQVTQTQALIWMVLQALISALILFTYNWAAIGLGVLALLPVLVYPFAKRFTWWPQAFLGIAFNWGALLLWAAHSGGLSFGAILLYLGGISWTLFYDTIYAHQDKEDDALIGVKSTARLFADKTPQWLSFFLGLSLLLVGLAIYISIPQERGTAPLIFALIGLLAYGLHMVWLLVKTDMDDPDACLITFRQCRDSGLLLVPFLAGATLF